MNGSETILAIIAACAIIAAALMAALAYRMNEQWTRHCEKINREWYEFYMIMVDMKAEAEKHE
jgi:peptidoglycan/LPS O-acetylase OafA/YrhL